MDTLTKPISAPRRRTTADTVYPILLLVSITHLLNDMMQSVIPAVYPLLKGNSASRSPRSESSRWFSR